MAKLLETYHFLGQPRPGRNDLGLSASHSPAGPSGTSRCLCCDSAFPPPQDGNWGTRGSIPAVPTGHTSSLSLGAQGQDEGLDQMVSECPPTRQGPGHRPRELTGQAAAAQVSALCQSGLSKITAGLRHWPQGMQSQE